MAARFERENEFLRGVLNALPAPIFVLDREFRVLEANQSAAARFAPGADVQLRRLCGEVLHCVHAWETPGGCGTTEFCHDCVIRASVKEAFAGGRVVRRRHRMQLLFGDQVTPVDLLVTATTFAHAGEVHGLLTLEDVTELVELRELLPICAGCKKIRNDQEYWEQVESYLSRHLDLRFTHGLCPDCARSFFPGVAGP